MEYYSYCLGEAAGCLTTGKDVHDAADEARRQEAVRICDVCERLPAAVMCKTDAAALCHACDADVHSAAASRHRRLPIIAPLVPIPVPNTTNHHYMNSTDLALASTSTISTSTTSTTTTTSTITVPDHDHIRFYNYIPHLITSSSTSTTQNHNWPLGHQYCFNNYIGAGANISHESVNPTLPLVTDSSWSSSSNHDQKQTHRNFQQSSDHHHVLLMGQQQGRPKSLQPSLITTTAPLQYYAHSTSTASDFPAAQGGSSSSSESIMKTIDRSRVEYFSRLWNYPPIGTTTTFMSMDRGAKILKYREKRKKRNYGKTVRYVNRKADAETRPRIGGRFARIPDKTT